MRVYVATSYAQRALAKHWITKLGYAGIEVTHDWTGVVAPEGGELSLPIDDQRSIARHSLEGVHQANWLWVITPEEGGCGCWIELGYAMRDDYIGIIVSGAQRTVFTSMPGIVCCATHEKAFDRLKEFFGGVKRRELVLTKP